MSTILFGIATRVFHYDRTVGRQQFSGHGFRAPVDIALGADLIYVLNRSWEGRPDGVRVTVLTIDEEYKGQFSQFGEDDGDLVWPTSIALDSRQNVYVADDYLHRISVFDKAGKFLAKWGEPGSGDGQLNKPSGIRFDSEDNLYLVDSGNHRVQKFTSDGTFLAKWGEAGSAEGQFDLPWGLALDHNRNVYVADWRNDRIQKFTADGRFLGSLDNSGNGIGEFSLPAAVAVDQDGDIYVADWGNERVQVFTSEGRYITTLRGDATMSKWGQETLDSNPDMVRQRALVPDLESEKRFWGPKAVAIDNQGRVVILDTNRGRLQVYRKDNSNRPSGAAV